MMQKKEPTTYQDWLNELYNTHGKDTMLACAVEVAKRAPDKKTAFHDVSLVLAQMYKRAMVKAQENPIVEREVKANFNDVTTKLFKTDLEKILNYIVASEPNFDPSAKSSKLGFIKSDLANPNKKPLGFIKTTPRNGNPSLGFME